MGQSTSLSGQFTFESISLELFAFCPRVKGMLRTVYWTVYWPVYWQKICPVTKVCYGRLGDDTIVSCEDNLLVGVSILPLICWQGPEDGNKRSSCYGPKRKKLSLQRQPTRPLWTYINKAVLSLEKVILVVVKPTTTSDDPSLLKLSI